MAPIDLNQAQTPEVRKKIVLTGRRAILAQGIAAFVANVMQGKVIAHEIPAVVIEADFVEGVTKAEIGGELMDIPDEEIEEMDPEKPTVGRTRKLVEKALGRVNAVFAKIRR